MKLEKFEDLVVLKEALKQKKVMQQNVPDVKNIQYNVTHIENFEDIFAWQKAKELTLLVYKIFSSSDDFEIKDCIQKAAILEIKTRIQWAAISVMNNIVEGFERRANNEYMPYLFTAKGLCGQVHSMCIIAKELNEIKNEEDFKTICTLSKEISISLTKSIKKLRKRAERLNSRSETEPGGNSLPPISSCSASGGEEFVNSDAVESNSPTLKEAEDGSIASTPMDSQ
jgi:four helix bundle protein